LRKDEQRKVQKGNEERLKTQMNDYIKTTKQERKIEKQERTEVQTFLETRDVADVFEKYE
jgi:hypothetical protein